MSIVVLICCLAVPCLAEPEGEPKADNKPDAGATALLFETGTDLHVGSYSGIIIGLKQHLSTTRAFELKLGFDGSLGDSKDTDENSTDTVNTQVSSTSETQDYLIRLDCVYLMYHDRSSNQLPFIGVGPTAEYGYRYSEDNAGSKSYSKYSQFSVGITGEVGFEWFALPKLSLRASYRARLLYRWSESESEREYTNPFRRMKSLSERNTLNFGHEKTNLGIVLYF